MECPAFSLPAAVSERIVSHEEPRPMVLVFHGPKTADAPKEVGKAVRAAYPDAGDVLVASIIDLRSMSGLWSKVAKASLKQTYERIGGRLEGDPAEYVVLCPDWDGKVSLAFGIDESNTEPAVVVVADGQIVGEAREALAERAVALIQSAA